MVDMAKAKESRRAPAKTGYSVRPATRDDLKPIVGLYNWAVNQTFATLDAEPLDREEAEEWWHAHGSKSLLLVAEGEEGVIGWGRLLSWSRRGLTSTVEDLVYVLKRNVTAVGYDRDEMGLAAVTYDDIRPGCFEPLEGFGSCPAPPSRFSSAGGPRTS